MDGKRGPKCSLKANISKDSGAAGGMVKGDKRRKEEQSNE